MPKRNLLGLCQFVLDSFIYLHYTDKLSWPCIPSGTQCHVLDFLRDSITNHVARTACYLLPHMYVTPWSSLRRSANALMSNSEVGSAIHGPKEEFSILPYVVERLAEERPLYRTMHTILAIPSTFWYNPLPTYGTKYTLSPMSDLNTISTIQHGYYWSGEKD